MRNAAAEALGQFKNSEYREGLPLEAVIRGVMKTQLTERT
jgi:hypothetical protein